MKSFFLVFLAACASLSMWAQQSTPKVGVNTKTPSYNLDVNGNFSATDIPEHPYNDEISLLKWIPYSTSQMEDNQGLLVSSSGIDYSKPFQSIQYYFWIQDIGEDKVDRIDLGIPSDRFAMFLTESDLLQVNDENFVNDHHLAQPALIPMALLVSPNRADPPVYQELELRADIPGLPTYTKGAGVMFPLPNVHLYKANSEGGNRQTWHFYADYPAVKPKGYEWIDEMHRTLKLPSKPRTYVWYAKVLVVDTSYMEALEDVNLDMGGSNSGTVRLPSELK